MDKTQQRNLRWSTQETNLLKSIIKRSSKPYNWQIISEKFCRSGKFQRNHIQCKEHWNKYKSSQLSQKQFSKQQRYLIFNYQKIHGNKWTEIKEKIRQKLHLLRSDNQVKNQYQNCLRKGLRRFCKSTHIDKPTEQKIKKLKAKDFQKIFRELDDAFIKRHLHQNGIYGLIIEFCQENFAQNLSQNLKNKQYKQNLKNLTLQIINYKEEQITNKRQQDKRQQKQQDQIFELFQIENHRRQDESSSPSERSKQNYLNENPQNSLFTMLIKPTHQVDGQENQLQLIQYQEQRNQEWMNDHFSLQCNPIKESLFEQEPLKGQILTRDYQFPYLNQFKVPLNAQEFY